MSSRQRVVAVTAALLLVLDAGAAYQVGVRAKRPPSVARGGRFLTTGQTAEPVAAPAEVPPNAAPAVTDGAVTTTASTPSTTRQAATTAPRAASSVPAPVTAAGATTAPPPPASVRLPASGTYLWDVAGTEAASGFGSRDFPSTMTMVAHRDGSVAAPEVVLDTNYSSNHTERTIVGVQSDGMYFDFEGGQVRFGPSAQTNQGDYRPPMLQVPFPLAGGRVRSGTTQVLASDGSVERTESWTVTVIGQEIIQAGGTPVSTWKITIDRHGSGGNQQVDRSRVLWYDPARRLWVKYTEKMHGQQSYGITFTYDEDLTATLESFAAG